ncbi:hypothetical protein BC831DRAFT_538657 [Entophlyctis helioformis]|nr:hypothetical protein BC831DRAFT_538657 [Entophlyctis helioformis]
MMASASARPRPAMPASLSAASDGRRPQPPLHPQPPPHPQSPSHQRQRARPLSSLLNQLADFDLDGEQDVGGSPASAKGAAAASGRAGAAGAPAGREQPMPPSRAANRPSPPSSALPGAGAGAGAAAGAAGSASASASPAGSGPLPPRRLAGLAERDRGAAQQQQQPSPDQPPRSLRDRDRAAPAGDRERDHADRAPASRSERLRNADASASAAAAGGRGVDRLAAPDADDWLVGDPDGAGALADLLSKSRARPRNGSASGRSGAPSERSTARGTPRTSPAGSPTSVPSPSSGAASRSAAARSESSRMRGDPLSPPSIVPPSVAQLQQSASSSSSGGGGGFGSSGAGGSGSGAKSPLSPQSPLPRGQMLGRGANNGPSAAAAASNGILSPVSFIQSIASYRIGSPFVDRPPPGTMADVSLFRRNSHLTSSSGASIAIELSDPSIMRQLVNEAMADCEGFQVMPIDKLDEKRRQIITMASQVASLQNKLSLESRIREAAESLVRSNAADPGQLNNARQQLADTTRKIDGIAMDIWKSLGGLIDAERTVFMHMASALKWQVNENQKDLGSAPSSRPGRGGAGAADDLVSKKKLASAESRVRELEQHVDVLKSTVARLESEQEPIRRLAGDAQREARRAREDRTMLESSSRNADGGQPSQLEINRMKLDLATSNAEMTDMREELASKKDALAGLQLQLEQDQSLIESKDRMISNLLGELEEATNQLEMVRAGGRLSEVDFTRRNRNSAMLRDQFGSQLSKETGNMNAALSGQLKDAVMEREKLKLKLEQERDRVAELESQLRNRRPSAAAGRLRGRGGNGSSTAGPQSESDTEPEADDGGSRYSRRRAGGAASARGVTSPRSAAVNDAELRELTRKVQEQEALIKSLEGRANRLTDGDEKLLRDVNNELEAWVGLSSPRSVTPSRPTTPPSGKPGIAPVLPSVSMFATRIRDALEDNRKVTQKLKDLQTQKDVLDRNLQGAQDMLRTRNAEFENKLSDMRRDYAKLQDELSETKTRLREAERTGVQTQDLESKMQDQERKLRALDTEKSRAEADFRARLATAERDLNDERQRLQDKFERERERIKADHLRELEDMQRDLLRESEEATRKLQRELDNVKASADQRLQDAIEVEMSSVKRRHQAEIEDLKRDAEESRAKMQRNQTDEIEEIRRRLESSEAALVASKQQFFVERERLQETIDEVQEEVRTMRAVATERGNEWIAKKREYEEKMDKLLDENEKAQGTIDKTQRELDSKSRELADTTERYKSELETLRSDYDARIAEMQGKLDEYQSLQSDLETLEKDYVEQLKQKDAEVAEMRKDLDAERSRASNAVSSSQEAQAEASDQLHRIERLLREAERDIDRYRRLADEKDNEVLTLKKTLRQKDKELLENVSNAAAGGGGGDNSSMRRLLDQKDREIEAARAETRAAVADIAALKRKVELKDREIEDAKSEMRRRAKASGDKDGAIEEVDRLQIMLMELKTSRVQLLEDLDNAQHTEQVLKAEVTTLKGEVAALKEVGWMADQRRERHCLLELNVLTRDCALLVRVCLSAVCLHFG